MADESRIELQPVTAEDLAVMFGITRDQAALASEFLGDRAQPGCLNVAAGGLTFSFPTPELAIRSGVCPNLKIVDDEA